MDKGIGSMMLLAAGVVGAGGVLAVEASDAPRRVNAHVSVVNAPAAVAEAPSAQRLSLRLDGLPVRVSPDGSASMDVSSRIPLGLGGYIDAGGELRSECSARSADMRRRSPLLAGGDAASSK